MAEVIMDTRLAPLDPSAGDHDKFAHVVIPAAAAYNAMLEGTPCTAICGHVWVPTRAPDQFPVCPECKAIMNGLGRDV